MDFSIIHLFIDLYLVVPVHLSSVVSERLFRFLTNEIFQYQVFLMWHKDRKITVEVGLKSSCLIYGWKGWVILFMLNLQFISSLCLFCYAIISSGLYNMIVYLCLCYCTYFFQKIMKQNDNVKIFICTLRY